VLLAYDGTKKSFLLKYLNKGGKKFGEEPTYLFENIAFDQHTELRFGVVLQDAACLIYEL
jgi:hypothetical protein